MIEFFARGSSLLHPVTELAWASIPVRISEIQRATVQGILKLKRKIEGFHAHAYPSVGADPPAGDHGDVIPAADHGDVVRFDNGNVVPPRRGLGCAACNASLRAQSPKHTRIG